MANEFKVKNGVITPTVQSTIATGTAPFIVASTTAVTNLNVDYLDGQHGSYYTNAGNLDSGTLLAARMPALTGDITSTAGSVGTTLATVNSNVGSFGSTSTVPVITVNAKGLITAVSTVTISSLPSVTGNSGKYLYTDGSTSSWNYIAATTVSATAPSSPVVGMKWLDTTTTTEYTYVNDGDSSQWVELGTGGFGGYVTLTGTQTLTNKTLTAPTITGYTETVYALGTSGTQALNPANGTIQTCAAAGAVTFTDSLASGQSIVLSLTGGSTYTITWPTTTWVTATGNVAPTLSAANTVVFWKIASTLYGALVGKSA